jgi:hypothetical protein
MFIYNILIVIFVFLIAYQIYLEIDKPYLIEGMDTDTTTNTNSTTSSTPTTTTSTPDTTTTPATSTPTTSTTPTTSSSSSSTSSYQDYGSSDSATNALILAQQNAGNIEFLKQQIDSLLPLIAQVNTLNTEVDTISSQINDLAQQQEVYAAELVGSTPPQITGADYTDPNAATTTTTSTT